MKNLRKKNGIRGYTIVKLISFAAICFLSFTLTALDSRFTLEAGLKYNSNLEYQKLYDRLKDKNLEKKESLFATTNGEAAFRFGEGNEYSGDYALYSDLSLQYPEYSRLNQYGTFGIMKELNERTQISLLSINHLSLSDYISPETEFFDSYISADLFYDRTSRNSFYLGMKGGYFKNISSELRYLEGPAFGFSGGFYLYESDLESYFKAGFLEEVFLFRDEECSICNNSLFISNKYNKTALQLEYLKKISKLEVSAAAQYTYLYWLKEDVVGSWKKRREEHSLDGSLALLYKISGMNSLKSDYSFRKNISTIGQKKNDYTDYNMTQHLFGVSVVCTFK